MFRLPSEEGGRGENGRKAGQKGPPPPPLCGNGEGSALPSLLKEGGGRAWTDAAEGQAVAGQRERGVKGGGSKGEPHFTRGSARPPQKAQFSPLLFSLAQRGL